MKSNFERYVERILQQTECNPDERADLFEEMLIHLELSRDELLSQGMDGKEAEVKAMEQFGKEEEIGINIQHAVFPFRKEFMLTLSLTSFLFTIGLYLLTLFNEGDAYMGWLIVSMVVNSLLLVISLNEVGKLNRRRWINSLFITHLLTSLYGYAIASSLDHSALLPLVILNWILILLALILVYQTIIYKIHNQGGHFKEIKRLHQLNFVSGIIVIGFTLSIIWGGLWLFGGFHPSMIVMMVPFALWGLLYYGQIKLVKKHKVFAFVLAVFAMAINLGIVIRIFKPLF